MIHDEALREHLRNLYADPREADLTDLLIDQGGRLLYLIEHQFDEESGEPCQIGAWLDFLPERAKAILRERYKAEGGMLFRTDDEDSEDDL